MSTSLTGLKIPRGYRGDWPLFEYQLIDFVEQNLNEVEDSREGDSSLLANLNSKYATKTYVQLAILNPTPGDIFVTDLGVAGADSAKIGYSLQINNAGTGLLFANTYKLGMGTFANPSLSFNSNSAGVYCSTDITNETLHIKLNNFSVCDIIQNKISGITLIDLGMLQLSSNGDIFAADIDADSVTVLLDVGCRAVRTTGTGALNRSIMAEVEINKGIFTGIGSAATTIAQANITTLAVTTLDQGIVTLLASEDLDTIKTTTKDYYANSGCTNMPSAGGGRLSVVFRNSNVVFQEFQGFSTPSTYTRYWDGSVWSAWLAAVGATGPTGATGATGPAGPAGSGNSNFGIIPIFESSTVGAITYSLPAGDTFLVLIMAGGGGGGLGAGSNGNDGADTVFTIDNDPGYVIATAKKGVGGRNTANMPNIALSYFSKYEAGIFNYIGQDNTLGVVGLTVEAIQCSQPGSYISDPTLRSYNMAPVFRLAALSGYDGSGGQASGVSEKGSAGGWCLLKLTKAAGTGSLTLNFDIGNYGVGGFIGTNDGSPGRVIIWST